MPTLPSKKVDLAWVTSYGAPGQQVAELIQTQLAPTGLDITVRAMPSAESFDLANQPAEKRPDLMVAGIGGDALHLDTVLRIFLRTGAKPLNYFQYGNPTVDRLMDEAITKPTIDETNQAYVADHRDHRRRGALGAAVPAAGEHDRATRGSTGSCRTPTFRPSSTPARSSASRKARHCSKHGAIWQAPGRPLGVTRLSFHRGTPKKR